MFKTTEIKFDFNDFTLVPDELSSIRSRKECDILKNGKLPLFVSPMDTVVDENNYNVFLENKLEVCIPRGTKYLNNDDVFYSFGLEEIENLIKTSGFIPNKVLIDIANAHSIAVYNTAKIFKEKYPNKILMVGNIANPNTYEKYAEIGVDYVRCGIGAGSACLSSLYVGVHYPMASLIEETYKIKLKNNFKTYIVADGGFRTYDAAIKGLSLGADYIMLGSALNKCIESCSDDYIKDGSEYIKINKDVAIDKLKKGLEVYKYFRGMSTKEVQKKWGKQILVTAEGKSMYQKTEYFLSGWIENFSDYLRSAMSYTDSHNLEEFKESEKILISQKAYDRFYK